MSADGGAVDGAAPVDWGWLYGRIEAYLARHCGTVDAQADGLIDMLRGEGAPGPVVLPAPTATMVHIIETLGLSPIEGAFVLAAAAPALSVRVARAYAMLWPDDKHPPLHGLCALVADDLSTADRLMRRLQRGGPLVDRGIVEWIGDRRSPSRGVRVAADVSAALLGDAPQPSPALAHISDVLGDAVRWPPQAQRSLEEALAALDRGDRAWVDVIGPIGSGRAAALTVAGPLFVVDLDALTETDGPLEPLLDEADRIARLCRLRLVFRIGFDAPPGLDRWLHLHPAVVLCTAVSAWLRIEPRGATAARVVAPTLSHAERCALWAAALRTVAHPGEIERDADRLATRFPVGAAAIVDAVRQGYRHGGLDGVVDALRRYVAHGLTDLAERYETGLGWSDVVLSNETERGLRDIVLYARHRHRVLDDWGMGRLLPYGQGLGCLFSGPPGTGKTMMAGIIARDLGLELYRIDISRVVSKWLGETEKNLARLFEQAEKASVILFFDDADSLFASRTDVKSSNDRFANMEVNFLLERMERFRGVSILATNLEQSLDKAVRRRLRFVVHFEEPDADHRAQLWARMLPPGAPRGEIDFARLGKRFQLTGGYIKNAVLRAAMHAAERGRPMDTALLTEAARAEIAAQGRLA